VAVPDEPAPAPAPALPKLIAVVSDDSDGATSLQAVFSVGDNVKVLKAGDAIGAFLIRTVTAEFVELLDPVTNAVHRLPLR
jgi:hypothetical protein